MTCQEFKGLVLSKLPIKKEESVEHVKTCQPCKDWFDSGEWLGKRSISDHKSDDTFFGGIYDPTI